MILRILYVGEYSVAKHFDVVKSIWKSRIGKPVLEIFPYLKYLPRIHKASRSFTYVVRYLWLYSFLGGYKLRISYTLLGSTTATH